jgi:hypothetical protein
VQRGGDAVHIQKLAVRKYSAYLGDAFGYAGGGQGC